MNRPSRVRWRPLQRSGFNRLRMHEVVEAAVDGWTNRDLDVGTIVALSPVLTDAQKSVYRSWGPGKYDPRYNIDGLSTPLALPPICGLAHVKNETYTADGPISYWNATWP